MLAIFFSWQGWNWGSKVTFTSHSLLHWKGQLSQQAHRYRRLVWRNTQFLSYVSSVLSCRVITTSPCLPTVRSGAYYPVWLITTPSMCFPCPSQSLHFTFWSAYHSGTCSALKVSRGAGIVCSGLSSRLWWRHPIWVPAGDALLFF